MKTSVGLRKTMKIIMEGFLPKGRFPEPSEKTRKNPSEAAAAKNARA
jgi:hypothetical protein